MIVIDLLRVHEPWCQPERSGDPAQHSWGVAGPDRCRWPRRAFIWCGNHQRGFAVAVYVLHALFWYLIPDEKGWAFLEEPKK